MLTRALAIAILPIVAAQNCDVTLPPPPTREEACVASSATWVVLGLAPEQVPELPDQLLKARIRVGETAALRASRLGQDDCDDLVTDVAWRSSVPAVADVTAGSLTEGRLEARSPGEAALWADVTLQGGSVRRAELHAVPAGRNTRLRVYAVVVAR